MILKIKKNVFIVSRITCRPNYVSMKNAQTMHSYVTKNNANVNKNIQNVSPQTGKNYSIKYNPKSSPFNFCKTLLTLKYKH